MTRLSPVWDFLNRRQAFEGIEAERLKEQKRKPVKGEGFTPMLIRSHPGFVPPQEGGGREDVPYQEPKQVEIVDEEPPEEFVRDIPMPDPPPPPDYFKKAKESLGKSREKTESKDAFGDRVNRMLDDADAIGSDPRVQKGLDNEKMAQDIKTAIDLASSLFDQQYPKMLEDRMMEMAEREEQMRDKALAPVQRESLISGSDLGTSIFNTLQFFTTGGFSDAYGPDIKKILTQKVEEDFQRRKEEDSILFNKYKEIRQMGADDMSNLMDYKLKTLDVAKSMLDYMLKKKQLDAETGQKIKMELIELGHNIANDQAKRYRDQAESWIKIGKQNLMAQQKEADRNLKQVKEENLLLKAQALQDHRGRQQQLKEMEFEFEKGHKGRKQEFQEYKFGDELGFKQEKEETRKKEFQQKLALQKQKAGVVKGKAGEDQYLKTEIAKERLKKLKADAKQKEEFQKMNVSAWVTGNQMADLKTRSEKDATRLKKDDAYINLLNSVKLAKDLHNFAKKHQGKALKNIEEPFIAKNTERLKILLRPV